MVRRAAAGLRVGGVYTYNAEVLQAYDDVSHFCTPCSLAQFQLLGLFRDDTFIDNYLADNAASLQANADIVTSGLESIGVPFVPPQVCTGTFLPPDRHFCDAARCVQILCAAAGVYRHFVAAC
jgi:aspartate/methionine/tyrosine aminotransferase